MNMGLNNERAVDLSLIWSDNIQDPLGSLNERNVSGRVSTLSSEKGAGSESEVRRRECVWRKAS